MNKANLIAGFSMGLVCGAVVAFLLLRDHSVASEQMAPGTEVGVLEDEVMVISCKSDAVTVTAQRSRQGERFAVQTTFANGSPPKQCESSPDLAGQLSHIAGIAIKRTISIERLETDFPKRLGYFEIWSSMINDEGMALELRESADGQSLAARYAGSAIEISNPVISFKKLLGGCASLAE